MECRNKPYQEAPGWGQLPNSPVWVDLVPTRCCMPVQSGNLGTPRFSLQARTEFFEGPSAQRWSLSGLVGCLWEEKFSASLDSILRGDHAVADSPGVCIDLKVIAALHSEGHGRCDLR